MSSSIYFVCYVMLLLFAIRWSFLVADKVPVWLDRDWRNQAEEFLEFKTISPPPDFRWWTFNYLFPHKHKYWWIPVVGPFLEKNYTQTIFEVLSLPLSLFLLTSSSDHAVYGILLVAILLALSLIDARTMLLPDLLVYPFMWIGVFKATMNINDTSSHLMGLILGFMILFILQQGFKLLRGKDGMGGGDVKLLAAIGAWVGVDLVIPVLLLACAVSIVMFILNKIFAKASGGAFPFGPSLAISCFVLYIFKPFVDIHI